MRKHKSSSGRYHIGQGPYRMKDNGQKMRSETFEITCELVAETPMAILVDDGDVEVWLPKSQIEFVLKHGGLVEVTAPEWLLSDKGLI